MICSIELVESSIVMEVWLNHSHGLIEVAKIDAVFQQRAPHVLALLSRSRKIELA